MSREKIIRCCVYLIGGICILLLVLGIYWLIWQLWIYVLGEFWPHGPVTIISPDYWAFVGCIFLLNIVGGILFNK